MKYTKEQRLAIGKEIYCGNLSKAEAALKYDINVSTAKDYMRLYRSKNDLPPKSDGHEELKILHKSNKIDYSDLEMLSKEQLIDEIIKARVDAERAKKGYTVKGSGQEKEFISLLNQNLK